MSNVKDLQGNEAEAFDLIMRKEFAWDILEGRKKLEFRDVSAFYIRKFLKPKGSLQKTFDALETKDCKYIHFHDYGNTWSLDVEIGDKFFFGVAPEGVEVLHKYDCHEFDEMAEENKGKKPDEVPLLFAFEIKSVLATSLCSLMDIEKGGKIKVSPIIGA